MAYAYQAIVFALAFLGSYFQCVREGPDGKPLLLKGGMPIPTRAGIVIFGLLVSAFTASIITTSIDAAHEHEIESMLSSSTSEAISLRTAVGILERRVGELTDAMKLLALPHESSDSRLTAVTAVVDANGWTSTGIELSKGQIVAITAAGTWSIWDDQPGIWPLTGPNGYINDREITERHHWDYEYTMTLVPLPTAHLGALIGKVGDHVFLVGAGVVQQIEETGILYLGCNDHDVNNIGSMVAEITIR